MGADVDRPTQPRGGAIDLVANGRALEQLLDLADRLPQRPRPILAAPVFRDLADGAGPP